MFFLRIIVMALRSLRANLLRSTLATLGVIIGVGAVIAANAILQGTRDSMMERFETLGSNMLYVGPQVARRDGRAVGQFKTLVHGDVEAAREECPSIKHVAAVATGVGEVKYFSRNEQVQFYGTEPQFEAIMNLELSAGRFLTDLDVVGKNRVAVLGSEVARKLFGEQDAIGKTFKAGTSSRVTTFRVGGILEPKGRKSGIPVDDLVIMPISTALRTLLERNHIDTMMAQSRDEDSFEDMKNEIKRVLRHRHRIRAGTPDDFNVMSPDEIMDQAGQFIQIMALVLGIISGISLVVGGIGIMNIMLVSVTERTREIGVRIAVGAQQGDIMMQFLLEASVISLLGGAVGILLGMAISDLVTQMTNQLVPTTVTLSAVILAIIVAVLVGIISGLYPAYTASRKDPVEALRYE